MHQNNFRWILLSGKEPGLLRTTETSEFILFWDFYTWGICIFKSLKMHKDLHTHIQKSYTQCIRHLSVKEKLSLVNFPASSLALHSFPVKATLPNLNRLKKLWQLCKQFLYRDTNDMFFSSTCLFLLFNRNKWLKAKLLTQRHWKPRDNKKN